MKLHQKTIAKAAAILTVLLLFRNSVPALTASADSLPAETETTAAQETAVSQEATASPETAMAQEASVPQESAAMPVEETLQETLQETQALTAEQTTAETITEDVMTEEAMTEAQTLPLSCEETAQEEEPCTPSDETSLQETADAAEKATMLEFRAAIEYSHQGYRVMGTFTEFPPDIIQIQPFCSQDQKTYEACGFEWDLQMIEAFRVAETKSLTCLFSNNEPLKSYLEGSLDRFYLKLRLTDKNGTLYETQTVLIDRGAPQPVPEEITVLACFASNMRVRETKPPRYYGKYQLTVKETATAKELSAVLPDTLPVAVSFLKKGNAYATGIVDCPVTWKALSLPSLTAGESITIADAAETIIIPAGTLVQTPVGIFRLDKPLGIEDEFDTDEVQLVFNVVPKDAKPSGVLTADRDGLELAFYQKPTGAKSIQVYTISEQEQKWTALPKHCGLALLDAVNAQPSTENSGYALVLDKEQEPYRSYLAAQAAGTQPMPFFVGLKIKGGVYDGQELILAYPNTNEKPLSLPKLGGAGGNESNAGAANKGDSTSEGQRPNLPQNSDTKKEEQNTNLSSMQTAESMTAENTSELPPDSPNTAGFIQPPAKVQAAAAANLEERIFESDNAAAELQTDTGIENAAVSETLPAANKLSAALAPSGQGKKTDRTIETKRRPLLLFVATASAIALGVILHTRKNAPKH